MKSGDCVSTTTTTATVARIPWHRGLSSERIVTPPSTIKVTAAVRLDLDEKVGPALYLLLPNGSLSKRGERIEPRGLLGLEVYDCDHSIQQFQIVTIFQVLASHCSDLFTLL